MLQGMLAFGAAVNKYKSPARVLQGDCLALLKTLPADSVDSCVTDPPYGLSQHKTKDVVACLTAWLAGEPFKPNKRGFVGMAWDSWVPGPEVWREVYRVLKPGGHALVFAGTRSMDLMCMALRLAGFEVRDSIGFAHDDTRDAAPLLGWCYSQGFPKSQNVSKELDKLLGRPRAVVSKVSDRRGDGTGYGLGHSGVLTSDIPNTPEADTWAGFGTSIKPAWEPIILVRKPLSEKTVAANVLKHGTGALNIDGCRIGTEVRTYAPKGTSVSAAMVRVPEHRAGRAGDEVTVQGRYPANVILDGSDAVTSLFPTSKSDKTQRRGSGLGGLFDKSTGKSAGSTYADAGGSATRFFYSAKTSRRDRDEGLEHLPLVESAFPGANTRNEDGDLVRKDGSVIPALKAKNHHPTVKPTALMRYLVRLVTPPGGTVLDPFTGSGSTGKGAVLEGFKFVGMELSADYAHIARARIAHATKRAKA